MKTTVYDLKGKSKGEIDVPKIFTIRIRPEVVQKCFETDKFIHPYSPSPEAGRRHSASGTISHKRHDWKGHYGKAISRAPRKTMWRRGEHFHWIGAEVSGTRGGRRVHGPKGIGKEKKVNKKEMDIAIKSGIAATANKKFVMDRYGRIDKMELKLPIVIESPKKAKAKEMINLFKKVYGELFILSLKKKKTRPGKGKIRGRKYKSTAGILLVKAEKENLKMTGIDIRNSKDLSISDVYPLGRLTIFTEEAIKELEARK